MWSIFPESGNSDWANPINVITPPPPRFSANDSSDCFSRLVWGYGHFDFRAQFRLYIIHIQCILVLLSSSLRGIPLRVSASPPLFCTEPGTSSPELSIVFMGTEVFCCVGIIIDNSCADGGLFLQGRLLSCETSHITDKNSRLHIYSPSNSPNGELFTIGGTIYEIATAITSLALREPLTHLCF